MSNKIKLSEIAFATGMAVDALKREEYTGIQECLSHIDTDLKLNLMCNYHKFIVSALRSTRLIPVSIEKVSVFTARTDATLKGIEVTDVMLTKTQKTASGLDVVSCLKISFNLHLGDSNYIMYIANVIPLAECDIGHVMEVATRYHLAPVLNVNVPEVHKSLTDYVYKTSCSGGKAKLADVITSLGENINHMSFADLNALEAPLNDALESVRGLILTD